LCDYFFFAAGFFTAGFFVAGFFAPDTFHFSLFTFHLPNASGICSPIMSLTSSMVSDLISSISVIFLPLRLR